MTSPKKRLQDLRHLHRTLAPIMVLPLLLTAITGVLYQTFELVDQGGTVGWLLEIHTGRFGPLNLEVIYPFLNGLGLLALLFTGISLWLPMRRSSRRRPT